MCSLVEVEGIQLLALGAGCLARRSGWPNVCLKDDSWCEPAMLQGRIVVAEGKLALARNWQDMAKCSCVLLGLLDSLKQNPKYVSLDTFVDEVIYF